MSIIKDEIPFVNSAIIEYIELAKKRMNEIEKFYKEYLALKKRIKIANEKLAIHNSHPQAEEKVK